MIRPGIFSRFSQPVHFFRFKHDNLLLSTARFSGYNLEKNVRLDYFTGIDSFPKYMDQVYMPQQDTNAFQII